MLLGSREQFIDVTLISVLFSTALSHNRGWQRPPADVCTGALQSLSSRHLRPQPSAAKVFCGVGADQNLLRFQCAICSSITLQGSQWEVSEGV